MNHLPYIAASYALGIFVPGAFALAAYLRVGAARRRLAVIDPRARRGAAGRLADTSDSRRQGGSA